MNRGRSLSNTGSTRNEGNTLPLAPPSIPSTDARKVLGGEIAARDLDRLEAGGRVVHPARRGCPTSRRRSGSSALVSHSLAMCSVSSLRVPVRMIGASKSAARAVRRTSRMYRISSGSPSVWGHSSQRDHPPRAALDPPRPSLGGAEVGLAPGDALQDHVVGARPVALLHRAVEGGQRGGPALVGLEVSLRAVDPLVISSIARCARPAISPRGARVEGRVLG